MEGGLVLIPSTAGLTAATTLTSVGLPSSSGEAVALTSVPLTMATLQNIPATDIVAAAAAAAIHNNVSPDEEEEDGVDCENQEVTQTTEDQPQAEEITVGIEIKSEPPPLEAPPQIHPVTLQAHQLQTTTLLPAHTVIEMLPQNLIEHQQLLQQQQQQLQAQQVQLQQFQQQAELQQQQEQQKTPKTKAKKEPNVGPGGGNVGGNGNSGKGKLCYISRNT